MKRKDFFKRLALLAMSPALIPLIKEKTITSDEWSEESDLVEGNGWKDTGRGINYAGSNPMKLNLEPGKKYSVSYTLSHIGNGTEEITDYSVKLLI